MERKFLSIGMMGCNAHEKYRVLQRGCAETWIPMCDKVYIFCGGYYDFDYEGEMINMCSNIEFIHLNRTGDDYNSASDKFWKGLAYLMENDPADWYAIYGSDNYVRYDRLIDTLKKFDSSMPLTLGGNIQHRVLKAHGVDNQCQFNIGGGGSYITHSALEMIFNKYPGNRMEQAEALLKDWGGICVESKRPDFLAACDVCLGHMSWELDIPIIGIRGFSPISWDGVQHWHMNGCFFSYNLESIIVCHNMSRSAMNYYHTFLGNGDTKSAAMEIIEEKYNEKKNTVSDINEHIPTLMELASECKSVCEIGVRGICSSWAFLKGLAENATPEEPGKMICVDIDKINMDHVKRIAKQVNVDLEFIQCDSAKLVLDQKICMVFIDSMHCYPHTKREIEAVYRHVTRYICFHDSTIDGVLSEQIRLNMDLNKVSAATGYSIHELTVGIWPAIEEFLAEHPEFILLKRYENNNGLTILKRISG